MPVALSSKARKHYAKALREIEAAMTDIGVGLRYDAEFNYRAMKTILRELNDAAQRIKRQLRE